MYQKAAYRAAQEMINVIHMSLRALTPPRVDNFGMTNRTAARATTLVPALAAVFAASWSVPACASPGVDPTPTNTRTATETTEPTQSSETEPSCGPPTLHVSSPSDGARVTAPFPIAYETECFSAGRDGTIYFTTNGINVDLHPQKSAGTVTVPDHPLQSGRRTVTIQLTDTSGRPLDNPEATVVMTIIIEGSRSAG